MLMQIIITFQLTHEMLEVGVVAHGDVATRTPLLRLVLYGTHWKIEPQDLAELPQQCQGCLWAWISGPEIAGMETHKDVVANPCSMAIVSSACVIPMGPLYS